MKCKNLNYFLVISIVLTLCIFCGKIQAMASNPTISINLTNMPLIDAVESVGQQINYQIILDKNCGNDTISGAYDKVPVEKCFAKLLKRQNASILFNYDEKIIRIECVGSNGNTREYQELGNIAQTSAESRPDKGDLQTSSSVEESNLLELSRLDPMPAPQPTSKTPQELDEMVDPETGLTLREMEKQMKIKID